VAYGNVRIIPEVLVKPRSAALATSDYYADYFVTHFEYLMSATIGDRPDELK
jgi:hypothetical protein